MSTISAITGLSAPGQLATGDDPNPSLPTGFKDDYQLIDFIVGEPVLLFIVASFAPLLQLVDADSGEVLLEASSEPLGFIPQAERNYLIRVTSAAPAIGTYTVAALPNTRFWTAGSGDWATANNWLNSILPGSLDQVKIDRNGDLTVTHSQGNTTINRLDSKEQISVTGGSLTVTDTTLVDALFSVSGGTVSFGGGTAIRDLALSAGTLAGNGSVLVTQGATWTSGTYSGKGLTIAPTSTLNLSGNLTKLLAGGILTNQGLTTWSGGTLVSNTAASVITNAAGGTFDIAGNLTLDQAPGAPLPTFNNAGLLKKTTGTGTASIEATLNNTGEVVVQAGKLALFGGGSNSGSFQIDADATLEFSNRTFTLGAGTVFTGAGTIRLDGGSLVASEPLSLSSGSFDGVGSFTGNFINLGATINPGVENPFTLGLAALGVGVLDISGDYRQGDNGTLTIQLGGTNDGISRQFDLLSISGNAEFDGKLSLDLINGFTPQVGDRFTIATFASRTPDRNFDPILQPELTALGLFANPEFSAQDLTLVIRDLPTLSFTNTVTSLAENTNTSAALRLADLIITDRDSSQNNLILSGADADFFEIFRASAAATPQLRLKINTVLDFETQSQYRVTVNVDDPAIAAQASEGIAGNNLEASQDFTLSLTDQFEAPPFVTNFGGDNSPDLVWRNGSAQATTGEASIVLMDLLTLESQVALQPFIRDRHWQIQATGDFDGDPSELGTANRKADLVWRNQATGQNVLWRMDGTLPLQAVPLAPVTDRTWEIRGSGDFDRNGTSDLIWYNTQSRQAVVWYLDGNTGSETRAALVTQQTETDWQLEGSGDFDGNGTADLVWSKGSEVSIWSMNGLERTRQQTLALPIAAGHTLGAIGDYNQDRESDLIWQNVATGQTEVWLRNAGESLGRFPLDRSSLNLGLNLVA
ncbi:MAG: hypothetical protein HC771_14645 [Synechococcales cyanobacterium CRU_2_2]|nr:hypothetical protein [Synechococcales cyanobacterium CRU_2_2]